MVRHLEETGAQVRAPAQEGPLGPGLDVAGQKCRLSACGDPQDQRLIVAARRGRGAAARMQHLEA
ncbi:MAG TPA: hypothetical protein VJV75_06960, partial [Candidatus Polarisedimenticolia bacterium]|nr:hypothetical protein [Candidatus Polarisedimenticolia bacterium]